MPITFREDGLARLQRPMEGLWEDPENLRVHAPRSVEAIAVSLRRFGQQKPIVIMPDGKVKAGNGTFRAAQQLGWTQIACVTWQGSEEAADAYAIADNRTAELSSWDEVLLAQAMLELAREDEALALDLGFTDRELQMMRKAIEGDQQAESDAATPSLTTVIEFRSEEEQAVWQGFLRYLKEHFPREETHAARVTAYIESL